MHVKKLFWYKNQDSFLFIDGMYLPTHWLPVSHWILLPLYTDYNTYHGANSNLQAKA